MKNLKIMTLLTLALAGVLLVLPSTASAQLPSGTFDIAFNGFCDGMELTRTGPVSLAGILTGCYLGDGLAGGIIAFNYQIVPFVSTPWVGGVVTSRNDQTDLSCILIYELNFTTQRWADYSTCGGAPLSQVNSGTFRFGQPSSAVGDTSVRGSGTGVLLGLPSTASASAQLPSGTFDIAFNGFCDGMELTRTGPVSLAGILTGCNLGIVGGTIAFNYQIVPFVSTPWAGGVVTSNNFQTSQSCILIYKLNFTTQRWADYQTCDGAPLSQVNSGTFRFGQPQPSTAVGDTSVRGSGKR